MSPRFNFFKKKSVTTAPIPVLHQGNYNYSGSITIKAEPSKPEYIVQVVGYLDNIKKTTVGNGIINALAATVKKQFIIYDSSAGNSARGGPAGYMVLRKYHSAFEKDNFNTELKATIIRSNHDVRWLAQECCNTQLPHWTGGSSASPFHNASAAESTIQAWLDTNSLPDHNQMDIIMLVLKPWLLKGSGSNTRITLDPSKKIVGGATRPVEVALFHELVHAYYNATGAQLGVEDSSSEDSGGRHFELMSVGLPPFDNEQYSENKFRAAIGFTPRAHY